VTRSLTRTSIKKAIQKRHFVVSTLGVPFDSELIPRGTCPRALRGDPSSAALGFTPHVPATKRRRSSFLLKHFFEAISTYTTTPKLSLLMARLSS
jgi:hypothetical protein